MLCNESSQELINQSSVWKKKVCDRLCTFGISPFLNATRPLDNRCSFLNIDILRFKQNARDTKSFLHGHQNKHAAGGKEGTHYDAVGNDDDQDIDVFPE